MKGVSPVLAAGLLLAAAAVFLWLGQDSGTADLGQALLEEKLGGVLAVETVTAEAQTSAIPVLAEITPDPIPKPVPVETVEEAWDEELRLTRGEETAPAEIRVDGTVSLELRNETEYSVDFTALPALPSDMELSSREPVVLIVHTHGSESYSDGTEAQTVFRSQDETESVIAVGEVLARTMEQRGYGVIHDRTLCDYPEYTGAYDRSRALIRENLERYPSIELVLDIHRDAVEQSDGSQMRMACTTEAGDMAQLMLVVGTDSGGLEHPLWQQNLSLAAVLQVALEQTCPGIMRPINLRTERFNQDLGALGLLVEVGASGNTLEEAKATAEALGNAAADVMDRYSGKSS